MNYNILHLKGGIFDICCNMYEPQGHYVKGKQPVIGSQTVCDFSSYAVPTEDNLQNQKVDSNFLGLGRRGAGNNYMMITMDVFKMMNSRDS